MPPTVDFFYAYTQLIMNHWNYDQNNSFNLDLFSDTHTLRSSIPTMNSQCVVVAKEVKIEQVIRITYW